MAGFGNAFLGVARDDGAAAGDRRRGGRGLRFAVRDGRERGESR